MGDDDVMEDDYVNQTILLAPGVRVLPVVHGSVEFTVLVRSLLQETSPALLALELPENMEQALGQAAPFIEQIPIITDTSGKHPTHFIMEPLEPLVEALRSAYELEIPYRAIDSSNELFRSWIPESFPDTYALRYMSVAELYDIYENGKKNEGEGRNLSLELLISQLDRFREIHMASRLRNLAQFVSPSEDISGGILLICGIRHVAGLRELLFLSDEDFAAERGRILELTEDITVPVEGASGSEFGDHLEEDPSDTPGDEEEPLEALLNQMERVGTDASGGGAGNPGRFEFTTLSRESPEVLEQPGYYNTTWNFARQNIRASQAFNRITLSRGAYRDAVDRYERESGELVPPQREKLFFRFTRNWSIVEKKLLPDAYRLVIAARGFGNDNFARIMYDTLAYLPPLYSPAFPEKKLTLDDLHRDSRLIRFRLKMKVDRRVPPPNILRKFKREKYPGEWREAWRDGGICSYPPEDLKVEGFGRYLQEKARSLMRGSETRTVPFSSSLLDGIDYRETIRNLHLGSIFVKEENIRGLEAGSVVVIFSEDDALHDWKVVWWGEHEQESDMAFYSTPPGPHVVGPGISRCTYGGFMLSYPPGRLHDIWTDEFYRDFEKPEDKLLAAAIEYNTRTAVVHLSDRAPNPKLQAIAGRMGQKIIHIPLSTMSAVLLGRVRRFHVLDSKERRDESDDYIW